MEKKTVRIVGALFILIAAGIAGQYSRNQKPTYVLDEAAIDGEYVATGTFSMDKLQEKADVSKFRIQINAETELNTQTGRANFLIGNPAENSLDLVVTVSLDDTGEQIYESSVLKPGDRIAYANVAVDLPPGEYPATAVFHMTDGEKQEKNGQVEAGIVIIVK